MLAWTSDLPCLAGQDASQAKARQKMPAGCYELARNHKKDSQKPQAFSQVAGFQTGLEMLAKHEKKARPGVWITGDGCQPVVNQLFHWLPGYWILDKSQEDDAREAKKAYGQEDRYPYYWREDVLKEVQMHIGRPYFLYYKY